MREYNYLEINLEPSSDQATRSAGQGATFDEAFLGGGSEEMSNAKGRGRARRQKRKLDRISKRKERKLAKTEAKDEVRSAKQESRLSRRKKRRATRQEMRDAQMEARQQRRTKRMEMREARKGKDEEFDEEDETNDTGVAPISQSESSDDDADDQGYTEDDDADDDAELSEDGDERGAGYYNEDVDSGQDNAGYDDDSAYDQYPTFEEEDSFDGEQSSFVSEVTGKKQVPAPVQKICLKIEWNNEMLDRLARQKQKMKIDGQDTSRIDQAIDQKFERNGQLENQLQQFIGADGSRQVGLERAKLVSQAKRNARKERIQKVIPQGVLKGMQKKGLTKQQIKEWWQSKGAKKFSSMNGEQGWDYYPDVVFTENFDPANWQPNDFEDDFKGGGFDPMSFANGDQTGGNFWKSVLIGAVIGGVAIYVIRRYKLLS